MNRAKIVNYYVEKVNDKDFTILDARIELEKNNIEEQEIRIIIGLVDNELHRRVASKSRGGKPKELIWVGGVITAVGLIFTIGTYIGVIKMGNYFLLAYGPILGGLSILFYGLGRGR